MTSEPRPARPPASVIVIGGGLAGLAAAGRLAKLRHRVSLLERSEFLGGGFAGFEIEPGLMADDLPSVLLLPAPWRDLFKKSGRPMEAELARHDLALVDGPAALHRFDDGARLALPGDRGGQFVAIAEAFGAPAAIRWRDLVDSLVEVWQALRPLGLETGPGDRSPAVDLGRWARRTVADVADALREPHLGQLVRDVAHREGSDPTRTPAWRAARLAVERTFGRWQLVDARGRAQRLSRFAEVLTDRLITRRVDLRLGSEATAVAGGRVHYTGPSGEPAELEADAVIATVNPWTLARLRGGRPRDLRGLTPALSPARTSTTWTAGERPDDALVATVAELVTHHADGPVIDWLRRDGDRMFATRADHRVGAARPDPSAGLAWTARRRHLTEFARRPTTDTEDPRLLRAGAWLRGGNQPDEQLLSGALASVACERLLGSATPG